MPIVFSERKNKRDRSLSVNISKGVAKCHHCEAISIRGNKEEVIRKLQASEQTWKNYTDLSDNLVKWCESKE